MAGSSDVTGLESILFADNLSMDGTNRGGALTTNGQLWIGHTASDRPNNAGHVKVGQIVSPLGTVNVGYSSPNITIDIDGGSDAVLSLTPDTGGEVLPVGGTIPTLGQQANTTATMQTYNDGAGNFKIADQTWATQYVVDPSGTVGLKGTFTTIQDAIDQAVADGSAATSIKTIYIRRGVYTENLVLPANSIHLFGLTEAGYGSYSQSPVFDVAVNGSVTFTAGAAFWATNIFFTSSSGSVFDITTAITEMSLTQCQVLGSGVDGITVSGGGSISLGLRLTSCYLDGGILSLDTAGDCIFIDSFFGSNITSTDSNLNFYGCVFGGTPTMTSNTSVISIYSSTFLLAWSLVSNAAASINLSNVSIETPTAITASGAGTVGFANVSGDFTVTSTTQTPFQTTNDLVQISTASGASYTTKPQDAVILVNGATTATVVPLASPLTGQRHTIKDSSGTALANNITITPSGKNIDGVASFVINVNYGSVDIVYNGSEWSIL